MQSYKYYNSLKKVFTNVGKGAIIIDKRGGKPPKERKGQQKMIKQLKKGDEFHDERTGDYIRILDYTGDYYLCEASDEWDEKQGYINYKPRHLTASELKAIFRVKHIIFEK